jgi:lysophospholipase L1-like esterase
MKYNKFFSWVILLVAVLFVGCKEDTVQKEIAGEEKEVEEIIEDYTFEIENKGIAGNTTINLLDRLESDVFNNTPDLVVLMVGTNDMLNSQKFVSYENYETNLSQIVERIKAKNAQVLLMSAPTVDSLYLYIRHDKNLFTDTPNLKLQKAKKIVEKIATATNSYFVDINGAFRAKKIPVHNTDAYIRNKKNSNSEDGVHLTPLGYSFVAENIYAFLKSEEVLLKYKHIICFGDSLTKGSGASGAGTVTGENYPSVLGNMLRNQ